MLGLAAVAAMAAMAFVGATSASANGETQLCNSHSALTCGSAATTISMTDVNTGRLLSSLVDVLCDDINGSGTPLALAKPQSIHITELSFEDCETNGGDGCEVTVLELPLSNLLKTGLDSGSITGTNGSTLVACEDVIFSTDIHCVYDATGLTFSVGSQHLTASNTQVDKISGSLCPDESFLDGLLVTTANRYVLA